MSPAAQREHNEQMTKQSEAVVMQAWDDLLIPEFSGAESTNELCQYIEELKDVIRELGKAVNLQEATSQSLAQANVRQTKIVAKLRSEMNDLRIKLMNKELETRPKPSEEPDES